MITVKSVITIHDQKLLDKIFITINGVDFENTDKANQELVDMAFNVLLKGINQGRVTEHHVDGVNYMPKIYKQNFNQFLVKECFEDYFTVTQLYNGLLNNAQLNALEKIKIRYDQVYEMAFAGK